MSQDISLTTRYWIDRVLSCLGIPDAERQDCLVRSSVALGDVVVVFMQPYYGERSHLVARAIAAEVPPDGRCESLYKMVLEVQGMLCGPNTPVLCLDWPARTLMVSSTLDIGTLAADDAAQVLLSIREMALQWRAAVVQQGGAAQPNASVALVRR